MSGPEALVQSWCNQIDVVTWKVGRGDVTLLSRLGDLSDEAISLANAVPPSARGPILDRLRMAAKVLEAAQDEVKARLGELPARRRAARRYVAVPQPVAAR